MDLEALADFNAVARHGGFGPASRATGRPKATLSRRVRALEAELGIRFIDRGSRALRLTETGQTLHRRTGDMLSEIVGVGEELADASGTPKGRLRVSVPAMAAGEKFGRGCAGFVELYPEVQLEVVADDRFVDPIADEFDIILRANPPSDSALVGHCVHSDSYVVAAHPSLPRPEKREMTVEAPAVMLLSAPAGAVWPIATPTGVVEVRPVPKLRLSSIALVRGAALAGAGAGLFPRRHVAADLQRGELVEWGPVPDRRVELWALHPSRRLTSAKVQAFLAALRGMYSGDRASPVARRDP